MEDRKAYPDYNYKEFIQQMGLQDLYMLYVAEKNGLGDDIWKHDFVTLDDFIKMEGLSPEQPDYEKKYQKVAMRYAKLSSTGRLPLKERTGQVKNEDVIPYKALENYKANVAESKERAARKISESEKPEIVKRFRDENGGINIDVDILAKATEAEGRAYYIAGEIYYNNANGREYLCMGEKDEKIEFKCGQKIVRMDATRCGLFLPNVSPSGMEFINIKDEDGKKFIKKGRMATKRYSPKVKR